MTNKISLSHKINEPHPRKASQPLTIHMNKLDGSQVKAQWYDPRNGTWKSIGQYPKNKGIQELVPSRQSEKEDWVLVLDAI